jgi:type VI secretion system protein ImpF
MASDALLPQDRLQPALLDRLTDDERDKSAEPPEKRVISQSRLRDAVIRDLAWLFNATRYETGNSLAKAPAVRRSVINYGLPALSGTLASSLDASDLEQVVRQAIIDFEPRIDKTTLQVKAMVEVSALNQHNVIGLEIRGQLWAQPVPLDLLIRTQIDLETGRAAVSDAPSGRT